MTVALTESPPGQKQKAATKAGGNPPVLSVDGAVLMRVAANDASRAELQRDLLPLFGKQMSGTAFRKAAELAISRLTRDGLALDAKGRICVTSEGLLVAASSPLLPKDQQALKQGWPTLRGLLALTALGIDQPTTAQIKATGRNVGLAAMVIQSHFDFSLARVQSANALRGALAVIALERAFGDRIKTGLGTGKGLPGKAGRVLAGQLFDPPREFSSDGKLVLALAADLVEATDSSVDALQIALIRSLAEPDTGLSSDGATAKANGGRASSKKRSKAAKRRVPEAANDTAPGAHLDDSGAIASGEISPPDMQEFAGAVLDAARPVSEGWPGNRKAFISLVWRAIRNSRPHWGLSEVAFKTMLSEAHRSGLVVLASADLKGRSDRKELEDSKILYKNTIWHFVRVED